MYIPKDETRESAKKLSIKFDVEKATYKWQKKEKSKIDEVKWYEMTYFTFWKEKNTASSITVCRTATTTGIMLEKNSFKNCFIV